MGNAISWRRTGRHLALRSALDCSVAQTSGGKAIAATSRGDNTIAQLTAGGIVTMVVTTTAKYMRKRILRLVVEEAVEQAAAGVGVEIVAEGVVTTATWVSISAMVAGVAYKVAVNVYNWDFNNAYIIDSCDNSVGIHGGLSQPFSTLYEDSTTWAPAGSYSATSTIPDLNIPNCAQRPRRSHC
ncbi:hypothetical protein DL768_008109 [Monosporascus sp. mg162]|nr:hypothetical protein DL768_008109 [Monosporascus sp. mg162]